MTPQEALKYHVTGAIERGEAVAIVAVEKATAKQWRTIEREIRSLLIALKKDIGDDYRATDDPYDKTPGMCVTVSTNDGSDWTYQTGDNSYSGGCYGHAHWSVIYLNRKSNSTVLAADAVAELADAVAELADAVAEDADYETSNK